MRDEKILSNLVLANPLCCCFRDALTSLVVALSSASSFAPDPSPCSSIQVLFYLAPFSSLSSSKNFEIRIVENEQNARPREKEMGISFCSLLSL
jgi:hypothetical protein